MSSSKLLIVRAIVHDCVENIVVNENIAVKLSRLSMFREQWLNMLQPI